MGIVKNLAISLAVLGGLPCLIGELGNRYVYSTGYRVGHINKLSEKGMGCKSYEGELALEGLTTTSSGKSNSGFGGRTWGFSIDSRLDENERKVLTDKIDEATENNLRVRLDYKEVLYTWPCRSDTKYLLTDVEILR